MSQPDRNLQTNWPDALIALLEAQQTMAQRLAALAGSQSEHIAHNTFDTPDDVEVDPGTDPGADPGAVEEYLKVLSKRQVIIDQFLTSQQELQQLTDQLNDEAAKADDDQRVRITVLVDKIDHLLQQVMEADDRDCHVLADRRDAIKNDLGTIGAGRQARDAYLGQKKFITRFADRRG